MPARPSRIGCREMHHLTGHVIGKMVRRIGTWPVEIRAEGKWLHLRGSLGTFTREVKALVFTAFY